MSQSRQDAAVDWVAWQITRRTRRQGIAGWVVWQVTRHVVRSRIRRAVRKIAAAGIVVLVLAGGFLAYRSRGDGQPD